MKFFILIEQQNYIYQIKKLGIFGQIHPILANQLNISCEIYLFEFDFELIQNQIQTNKLKIIKNIHHIQK
jgi:phenylalanyl-tRNA synthetase beta subunit